MTLPQPLAMPPFPSPCLLNLSVASIKPPPLAIVLPDCFLPVTTSPKVILFLGGAKAANFFSFGVVGIFPAEPPLSKPTLPPEALLGLGPLKSFLFTPDGSLILPAHILLAYALAYAVGYTLNFLFAAAFPLGHSFVITTSLFVLLF